MAELAAQQRRGAPAGSQSECEADVSLFALREEMNEKWTTMAEQKARTLFNRIPQFNGSTTQKYNVLRQTLSTHVQLHASLWLLWKIRSAKIQ